MKITASFIMAAMLGASARPVQARHEDEKKLIVYLEDDAGVQGVTLLESQRLATAMFKRIGVDLEWRLGQSARSPSEQRLVIELLTQIPENFHRGALAFSGLYRGVDITVFYSRVHDIGVHSRFTALLLAHVLVHEITHVLQGTARHSEAGIMKARWTLADFDEMEQGPLSFTRQDVDLIHDGLAQRASRAATNSTIAERKELY
jgi:hypothetical protein